MGFTDIHLEAMVLDRRRADPREQGVRQANVKTRGHCNLSIIINLVTVTRRRGELFYACCISRMAMASAAEPEGATLLIQICVA